MSCLNIRPMSQIVRSNASPKCNSLCVEAELPEWHIVGVEESDNKNGGPNFLRAWRMYRDEMTQEELARRVGTSANMIGYLEAGERGLSAKWLRRLADALETTPGALLDIDPEEADMNVVEIWLPKMNREKRLQLAAIAEALVKTGTTDK